MRVPGSRVRPNAGMRGVRECPKGKLTARLGKYQKSLSAMRCRDKQSRAACTVSAHAYSFADCRAIARSAACACRRCFSHLRGSFAAECQAVLEEREPQDGARYQAWVKPCHPSVNGLGQGPHASHIRSRWPAGLCMSGLSLTLNLHPQWT